MIKLDNYCEIVYFHSPRKEKFAELSKLLSGDTVIRAILL